MKTVCVYHSIDLDGWMSAAIVKYWFIKNYEYCIIFNKSFSKSIPSKILFDNRTTGTIKQDNQLYFIGYNHGQSIPDLSQYDKVIMCDISFPKELMEKLYLSDKLTWIDHHISAINDYKTLNESFPRGLQDTNYAACELTWKYFFTDEEMPEIVRLLGRYDCFGHKGTDEEQYVLHVQYGARSVISNYEQAYEWLQYALKDEFLSTYEGIATHQQIEQRGLHIYDYLYIESKQTYKNGFEIIFTEQCGFRLEEQILRKFICINKERFNPINFGIDYHKDGYDGAACFHYANGKWNFSLYNDNGLVDCSVIAKQFGGGGHQGSSGFILNTEDFLKLING